MRLGILVPLLAGCASAGTPRGDAGDWRLAVLSADERFLTAYDRHDSASVRAIFAPEARMTHASGRVSGTEDEVRAVMDRPPPELDARWRIEAREARRYGDAAVVTGRYVLAGRYKGESVERPYHYTTVYAASRGAWRLVHVHFSQIPRA